jgi:hypothetical protein
VKRPPEFPRAALSIRRLTILRVVRRVGAGGRNSDAFNLIQGRLVPPSGPLRQIAERSRSEGVVPTGTALGRGRSQARIPPSTALSLQRFMAGVRKFWNLIGFLGPRQGLYG